MANNIIEALNTVRQCQDACLGLLVSTVRLGVVTSAVAGVGYGAIKFVGRLRNRKIVASYRDRATGHQVDAICHVVETRDVIDDEGADITVESQVEDGSTVHGGPPGLAPRGPALRRTARKQKVVHVDDTGRPGQDSYYGFVVAQARTEYAARGYSTYNAQLARSYMVRVMREHGVRPSHIMEHLEYMVNSVFFISEDERVALRERDAALRAGAMHVADRR